VVSHTLSIYHLLLYVKLYLMGTHIHNLVKNSLSIYISKPLIFNNE
jgi:hypothetical protein